MPQIDEQQKSAEQYDESESAKHEYNRLQQMETLRISSESKSLQHIPYIKFSDSIIANLQHYIADAAIFQAHRFRVNWSMFPSSTTYTSLDLNLALTQMQLINLMSPSTIPVNNLSDSDSSKLNTIRDNCTKYLTIQLELTDFIATNKCKLPLLRPKQGNDLIKQFNDCIQEIRNQIGGKNLI